jgi:hypothetical protein
VGAPYRRLSPVPPLHPHVPAHARRLCTRRCRCVGQPEGPPLAGRAFGSSRATAWRPGASRAPARQLRHAVGRGALAVGVLLALDRLGQLGLRGGGAGGGARLDALLGLGQVAALGLDLGLRLGLDGLGGGALLRVGLLLDGASARLLLLRRRRVSSAFSCSA